MARTGTSSDNQALTAWQGSDPRYKRQTRSQTCNGHPESPQDASKETIQLAHPKSQPARQTGLGKGKTYVPYHLVQNKQRGRPTKGGRHIKKTDTVLESHVYDSVPTEVIPSHDNHQSLPASFFAGEDGGSQSEPADLQDGALADITQTSGGEPESDTLSVSSVSDSDTSTNNSETEDSRIATIIEVSKDREAQKSLSDIETHFLRRAMVPMLKQGTPSSFLAFRPI